MSHVQQLTDDQKSIRTLWDWIREKSNRSAVRQLNNSRRMSPGNWEGNCWQDLLWNSQEWNCIRPTKTKTGQKCTRIEEWRYLDRVVWWGKWLSDIDNFQAVANLVAMTDLWRWKIVCFAIRHTWNIVCAYVANNRASETRRITTRRRKRR